MKYTEFLFLSILTVFIGCSDDDVQNDVIVNPPAAEVGYYDNIDLSQTPDEIETQLSSLITNTHTTYLRYTPDVWNNLKITDLDPNNSSKVLLFYGYDDNDGNYQTDRTRNVNFNCTSSTGCDGYWNREHVYPKSLGTPNLGTENAGSDAHALRACDTQMNSTRSNRVFADGNGNAHITPQGYWYPGDEWRGDVARIIMYMHLRYPTQTPANRVAISENNYDASMPDIFLEWNAEDPVSQYEIQRNEYLNTTQGNRNPFIDNPYLATIIWGGIPAENLWD